MLRLDREAGAKMKIRWLWCDHIPLELMLTLQQRCEVRALARDHRRRNPRYRESFLDARRLLVIWIPVLIVAFIVWMSWLPTIKLRAVPLAFSTVAGILTFNGLIWMTIAWALYRSNAPYIRWALWEIGKPVCIGCGYILTGGHDHTRPCPECGEKRDEPEPNVRHER